MARLQWGQKFLGLLRRLIPFDQHARNPQGWQAPAPCRALTFVIPYTRRHRAIQNSQILHGNQTTCDENIYRVYIPRLRGPVGQGLSAKIFTRLDVRSVGGSYLLVPTNE